MRGATIRPVKGESVVKLTETRLPGVGQRIEFITEDGRRVGVVHMHGGRRELFLCSPEDPDAVTSNLRLSDDESHALADALGGTSVVERLEGLGQQVEGLAIDWLAVDAGSGVVGSTIGAEQIRTRTGVSVVAVIRDGNAHPAPEPDFEIASGDVFVVVGTSDGVASLVDILSG